MINIVKEVCFLLMNVAEKAKEPEQARIFLAEYPTFNPTYFFNCIDYRRNGFISIQDLLDLF